MASDAKILELDLMLSRNDILRERGIIPPKPPSPTPIIQEALREAQQRAHDERLESKDLDELDELEDEEDETFLDKYRCVLLANISEQSLTEPPANSGSRRSPVYPEIVSSTRCFICRNRTTLKTSQKPPPTHLYWYI